MKKILFIGLTALTCFSFSIQAQQKSKIDLLNEVPSSQIHKGTHVPKSAIEAKKTRGGSRWYSSADAAGKAAGTNLFDQAHLNVNYLWQDSTLLGNFGTPDNIWIRSIAQVLDPTAPMFNDVNNYAGEIGVGKTSVISLDSVAITCAYVRNPAKANIVDTLIVTVSKGNSTPSDLLFWAETQAAVVNSYSIDTIYVAEPVYDYTTWTLKKNIGSIAYTMKMPLTVAVANDTTANGWNVFAFGLPAGLQNLPPASYPVITMNFKSGDTWTPNVDSAFHNGVGLNHILFASSRENPPAGFRAYTKRDYNISHIMKNDTTGWGEYGYIPSFYFNSPGFEHHWFDWKITCATCAPVGMDNITVFNDINVYPNPASSELSVVVNLKESAKNVTLDITNTLGQVVKTTVIGDVTANQTKGEIINISDLSTGMYIYTIHANGQKSSNKLLVK